MRKTNNTLILPDFNSGSRGLAANGTKKLSGSRSSAHLLGSAGNNGV